MNTKVSPVRSQHRIQVKRSGFAGRLNLLRCRTLLGRIYDPYIAGSDTLFFVCICDGSRGIGTVIRANAPHAKEYASAEGLRQAEVSLPLGP